TPRARLAHLARDGIADAGAALPVEHQRLGQSLRLDVQVPAVADRIEIAARRAHAATAGDRRLAHRDAFLAGAVVIRVVPDADLRRRLDDRREQRILRCRVGDAQRAVAAAQGIVALAGIAFPALEERQKLGGGADPVARLLRGGGVLTLVAGERHAAVIAE